VCSPSHFKRDKLILAQSVVPYVVSDWLSYLVPAILSSTIYIVLVYFISDLRSDHRAARLFTMLASVWPIFLVALAEILIGADCLGSVLHARVVAGRREMT
jgi:hypothetical protein